MTTKTQTEFIPIEKWGKDHWSTLAYIETVLGDSKEFRVKPNPRMRTGRVNWRLLTNSKMISQHAPMSEYPTRLYDGTEVPNHDDWSCLLDMEKCGLVKAHGGLDINKKVTLTDKGIKITAQLREHKIRGGNFSTFKPII